MLRARGHVDEVARAVGREPIEVRLENMIAPEQMPYTSVTGMRYDTGDYAGSVRLCAELLNLLAVRARQRQGEPDGRLIGMGFASFTEQTAHGAAEFAASGAAIISRLRELHSSHSPRWKRHVDGRHPVAWARSGDGAIAVACEEHANTPAVTRSAISCHEDFPELGRERRG
jgi:CO/xanthine dehydrogenase Mo-binding subunit